MADNITTPGEGEILAFKEVGIAKYPLDMLVDQTGTDAMGLVTSSPAANTVLGRLKAIETAMAGLGTATQAFTITPHATNAVSPVPRAIMVAVAGNVALRADASSADVTLTLSAGVMYPIAAEYVRVTGTTATGITGFA